MWRNESWSLQARLHVAAGCVFALAALAVVLLVNRQQREATLRVSQQRANAILQRNLAIHAFYAEELRPAIDAVAARSSGAVPFDPTWMSSSYAARRIDARVPSSNAIYYYKECAIDARNPASEADDVERAFLQQARADARLTSWSGQRTIGGREWFVVMHRGETMQRACLQCHSTPELAPPELVQRYGPIRGFNRREGELGSALSVRIPIDAAFAEANAFSLKLSAVLLGVLLAIYVAQWAVYRRLLHRPLRTLQLGALRLAARTSRRCDPLPVPAVPELRDVTVAFNAMAASIARSTDELEAQVEERTREVMERDARLRQAQKMEAVGRLAGGIAHDFNNLLTVIRGNADLLVEELSSRDAPRDDLEEIRAATTRATNLTRQLLAFSRRDVSQHRPLDPDAVIAQLARMLRRLLPANVVLSLDLAAEGRAVSADAGQLEQVIVNLVVNARDALPSGGHIRVETRRLADADADSARDGVKGGAWVRLAVCDDGIGMEPAVLAHVFEPFFTTKPRDQGTGLGLATAYGIVQQHGGQIAIDSSVGRGCEVRVYLPVIEGAELRALHPPAPARTAPGHGSGTVLLAEDEPAVRRLASAALRRRGYRVLEADSGEEALRVAATEPAVDLLLSDVVMSGIGGHVLAERLRAARPGIAVLLTSGYAPDEAVRARLASSGAGFLQKPFTPDELLERVAALIRPRDRAA